MKGPGDEPYEVVELDAGDGVRGGKSTKRTDFFWWSPIAIEWCDEGLKVECSC